MKMKGLISLLIIVFLHLASVSSLFGQVFPGNNWDQKSASEFDFDIRQFESMENEISTGVFGEIHSVVVIKDGFLAYENYFNGWHRDSLQSLQSITKSIIATYAGIAIQNEYIDVVDVPILPFFEDSFNVVNLTSNKTAISLRHLMTMQSEFEWEDGWNNPNNTWNEILGYRGDWYKKILDLPVTDSPGTSFQYQNGNPTLVTGLIQQASGQSIIEFAQNYLFEPLSITNYNFWQGNGGPENNGHALIYLRPVDLAKIGYLYLNKGRWKSKQIIPEWYVEEATHPHIENAEENPFYTYDYGYFWWINPRFKDHNSSKDTEKIFMARGAGGQNLIIWPEQNLICVITAWNLERPNITQTIFDRFILPAVKS